MDRYDITCLGLVVISGEPSGLFLIGNPPSCKKGEEEEIESRGRVIRKRDNSNDK